MSVLTHLADLFANYINEILIFSLALNFVLIILLLRLTTDQGQLQIDPVKRAIYQPKLFRKGSK